MKEKKTAINQDHLSNFCKKINDLELDHSSKVHIENILETLMVLSNQGTHYSNWKLLSELLEDLKKTFKTFSKYRNIHKVTVFGSARTSPEDPIYLMAEDFSRKISNKNYMVITGAGPGIMEAGNRGAGSDKSFGLNIELPFEQEANPYIIDKENLISFNYFLTRKLTFIRESSATVVFPGGFGTLDELFENITLIQTGKTPPHPVLLLEPTGDTFWSKFNEFINCTLKKYKYINFDDTDFFKVCYSVDEAISIIDNFYKVYHSMKTINSFTYIWLKESLDKKKLEKITNLFKSSFIDQKISQYLPDNEENSSSPFYPSLPYLKFQSRSMNNKTILDLILLINNE
ncbi:hypothetical protein AB834_02480 [PVC group bacterium (ex Bugula neritina AB1)]|nr:hypothetical protein AB834_02480 [PVC group bacterium (ex Bugula neritina AB1)]